jgi:hypothetical protein
MWLTANIILLFGAGHDHRQSDRKRSAGAAPQSTIALLKANPALIENAIEEFAHDPAVDRPGGARDIDDLGGKKIPKGESVLCLLGSANRDSRFIPTGGSSRYHPSQCASARLAGAFTIARRSNWRASGAIAIARCCAVSGPAAGRSGESGMAADLCFAAQKVARKLVMALLL